MKNPKTKRKATQSTGTSDQSKIDPRDFILAQPPIPPLRQPETASLPARLKLENVFYYAASGFDWYPLCRFSDRCSLFVYADWWNAEGEERRIEEFEAAIRGFQNAPARESLQCGNINELQPEQLGCNSLTAPANFLVPEELRAYEQSYRRFGSPKGWGRTAELTHTVGDAKRHPLLIYLCAEGVTTYLNLFKELKTAPRYLCIKGHASENYTDFQHWAEPLGRAVRDNWLENDAAPEGIIAGSPPAYDWPWKVVVERFEDWAEGRPTRYKRSRPDPFHPNLPKGTKFRSPGRVTHWPMKSPTDIPDAGPKGQAALGGDVPEPERARVVTGPRLAYT